MAKFSDLAVDETTSDDGVWFNLGAFEIKLRPSFSSNERFTKKLMDDTRKDRLAIDCGALSPQRASAIMHKVFAETVVVDWRGLENDDGTPMPFSVEACIRLFTINPKVMEAVQKLSADDANFRRASLESAGKN